MIPLCQLEFIGHFCVMFQENCDSMKLSYLTRTSQVLGRDLSRFRQRASSIFVPYFFVIYTIVLRCFIEQLSNNYGRTIEQLSKK